MLDQLCQRIQEVLPWDKLVCKDGNTQHKERLYIPVIRDVIEKMGGTIRQEAGSQQAMDFREIKLPGLDFVFDADGKSVNKGFKFMFNDSVPSESGYYMFIQVEHQAVAIKRGTDIINHIAFTENIPREDVITQLQEREDLIKRFKNFKIGNKEIHIESYARPSWSVKLPQEWFGVTREKKSKEEIVNKINNFFDGKWPRKNSEDAKRYEHFCCKNDSTSQLTTFFESLTQQSSESMMEEQHSQAEQPDPSTTLPSHSPLEIPESV